MIKLIFPAAVFIILYLVAFFNNLHYREDDDILWVSRSQWKAIVIMLLPLIAAILLREK